MNEKKVIDRSKSAITSRRKGHTKERDTVNKFKEAGYSFAKTSRQASRLLDDSKVDIAFVPYLVQCKKGYPKGLNYTNILLETKDAVKVNFPPGNEVHGYPAIIIHDKGKKKEEKLVVMEETTFWEFVKKIKQLEELSYDNETV